MGIHSARLAHLRRRIRCQCLTERLILRPIPNCPNAFFDEAAEVDAVGRSNHAAWHAQALIAGVGTAPGPIAARWARRASGVSDGAHARQSQANAQLAR